MKLTHQQLLPLAILYAADGSEVQGKTRMTKLTFLAEDRLAKEDVDMSEEVDFSFYPYDYGPFSKELLEELERFEENGIIEVSETNTFRNKRVDYALTPPAERELRNWKQSGDSELTKIFEAAEEVVEDFNTMSIRSLLDYIYEKYPQYQKNSVYF
jgi:uncharacterized protein YwgA